MPLQIRLAAGSGVTSLDGPSDSQEVVFRASDNNPAGASSSQLSFALNVANVAPTVNSPTVSPDSSNEGATVTAQATWRDPGVLDVATCTVDYGDGSGPMAGVANFDNGNGLCTGPSHVYTDSGSYEISIVVTDKDGGIGSNRYTYIVNNLPPVIGGVENYGPIKADKGVLISVNATDPAGPADPLTYAFDCDNDSVYENGPQRQNRPRLAPSPQSGNTLSTFRSATMTVASRPALPVSPLCPTAPHSQRPKRQHE